LKKSSFTFGKASRALKPDKNPPPSDFRMAFECVQTGCA
jgi:hypothetical protein